VELLERLGLPGPRIDHLLATGAVRQAARS
jgi:hypothetical protein